jgi:hypothetical protein
MKKLNALFYKSRASLHSYLTEFKVAYTYTKIHSNKGKQALHYVAAAAAAIAKSNQVNQIKQELFPFSFTLLTYWSSLHCVVEI